MIIMRSDMNMKDKLFKRRVHINWNQVRIDLEDFRVNNAYNLRKSYTPWISDNRLSYWSLLQFYDKKILDYFRRTKDFKIFTMFDFGLSFGGH